MFDWLLGSTSTDALGNIIGSSPGLLGSIGSGLANIGTAAWDGLKGVGDFAGFDGKFGFDGAYLSEADKAAKSAQDALLTTATTAGKGLAAAAPQSFMDKLGTYGPAALGAYSQYNQSQAAGELTDLKKQAYNDEQVQKQKNSEAIRRAFGGTPATGYSPAPTTTSI